MNKIFFLLALIASISFSPAFAQEVEGQKITVTTDNSAYQQGDIITVAGSIEKILPGTPVIMQIFFERTQVDVAQLDVSKNGKFSTTFVADGPLWSSDGLATLRVAYGSDVTEASFDFFEKTQMDRFISNYEVTIPDAGTFDIPYTIKGGTIESISLNQKSFGIDIDLITQSDGYIQLKLYRDYIDSLKGDGSDEVFIIVVKNSQNEYPVQTEFRKIETTDEFRSIEIPLKNGDSHMQIIGTFAIPEFATVAQLVLIIAIISIIAITAKTKFRINNF